MKKFSVLAVYSLFASAGYGLHAMDLKEQAFSLYCAGDYKGAAERFGALELRSLNHDDCANYGQTLMALGNYKQGMKLFEKRLCPGRVEMLSRRLTPDVLRAFCAQAENKDTPLVGKTIAVINEPGTGLGDWFTFANYASQLKKAGAKVIFQVPGPIKAMMMDQDCADEAYSTKETLPATDAQCFVMSLPALVSNKGLRPVETTDDLLRDDYLKAPEEEIVKWRSELQGKTPIGIVWNFSGNAVPGGRFMHRGLPVELLARLQEKLAEKHHVQLINLDGKTILSREEFASLSAGEQEGRLSDVTKYKEHILYADAPLSFKRVVALLAHARLVGGAVVTAETGGSCLSGAAGVATHIIVRGAENTDARHGTDIGMGTQSRLFKSGRMYTMPSPDIANAVVDTIADNIKKKLPVAF